MHPQRQLRFSWEFPEPVLGWLPLKNKKQRITNSKIIIITYSYFLNSTQTIWKSYRYWLTHPQGGTVPALSCHLLFSALHVCSPLLLTTYFIRVLDSSWFVLHSSSLCCFCLLPATFLLRHTNLLSLHLFINKIPLLTGDGIRFASSTLLPQQDVHIPILMFFYLCLAKLQNSKIVLVRLLFAQFCSNYLFITFYFAVASFVLLWHFAQLFQPTECHH